MADSPRTKQGGNAILAEELQDDLDVDCWM
jgi:hypothetical protein